MQHDWHMVFLKAITWGYQGHWLGSWGNELLINYAWLVGLNKQSNERWDGVYREEFSPSYMVTSKWFNYYLSHHIVVCVFRLGVYMCFRSEIPTNLNRLHPTLFRKNLWPGTSGGIISNYFPFQWKNTHTKSPFFLWQWRRRAEPAEECSCI